MFLTITFYIDSRYNNGNGELIYFGAMIIDFIGANITSTALTTILT